MMSKSAVFRFYEELNDFLPKEKKKVGFFYPFEGNPSVKDAIEAIGIPHVEVDLILVNGKPVDFKFILRNKDSVSVYPVFEKLDISGVSHLRKKPLRKTKFILDVHLGKLAKYLRMLGFDTIYQNNYKDPEIVEKALSGHRIILTRDIGILKIKKVTHGYWIRSQKPKEQLIEVIEHFDLYKSFTPFNRCIECNSKLRKVRKVTILHRLEPNTEKFFNSFFQCSNCRKIFWEGSHYERMTKFIEEVRGKEQKE